MFVPFVYNYDFEENWPQNALNSDEVQNRTQTRINILRLLSNSSDLEIMNSATPYCNKDKPQ